MIYRLVEVTWADAVIGASWVSPDDLHGLGEPNVSVGWLIREDDECLALAATRSPEQDVNQTIAIPRGMVRAVRDISC